MIFPVIIDINTWKTVVLTKIVDEADQVEPFLVRVLLSDPLCSLESVHNIRQVQVGITFVNLKKCVCETCLNSLTCQLVEHVQSLHDGRLHVVELQPFFVLLCHKGHRLEKFC